MGEPAENNDTSGLLKIWDRHKDTAGAADAIYETLREAILHSVLPAGDRLGEMHLAALFERSRTPIREAVLRLESERLAERSARRGLIVASITREEILEVYAVREVLDGLAARLAAHGILPAEYDQLVWLNQELRKAAGQQDFATMIKPNIEFHESVCRASRNKLLLNFLQHIHHWVRRFPETTFAFAGRSISAVDEHQKLLDALKQRDPDAAERIAREHMMQAMQVRVQMLQSSYLE